MKILTMKFGGTSVADIERIRAVRDIISDEVKDGWNVGVHYNGFTNTFFNIS